MEAELAYGTSTLNNEVMPLSGNAGKQQEK